jgi:plasmid stabilization system protein ParE
MTPRYRLTDRAISDLVETWEHVSEQFGERVADRVLDELESAFAFLATHPDVGHSRTDLIPLPWQIWSVGPALIACPWRIRSHAASGS